MVTAGKDETFVVRTSDNHNIELDDVVDLSTLHIGRIDGGEDKKLIFFISEAGNITVVGKHHKYVTPEQMKGVW